MSITPLPDPPSRSDPTNFPERADAFMAALPQFASEANALQEQVNEAAAAADDYKDAASSSAAAADGSAANALLSETHAQGSATAAVQARTDAETARDLAKDWASKASGTVAGTALLSAKQYAELAAAGAGVPIYATIPTADKGPICVIGVGLMEWAGTTYVPQRDLDLSSGKLTVNHDGGGRIINGDMRVSQRGTSFSVPSGAALYTLDRYAAFNSTGGGTYTVTQSASEFPVGIDFFSQFSLKVTINTANASPTAGYIQIRQLVEGYLTPDLFLRDICFSFWARCSKLGTYYVSFRSPDGTASFVAPFTVTSTAWARYVIPIPGGLPNFGNWNFNTSAGLNIAFILAGNVTANYAPQLNQWISGSYINAANQANLFDTVGNTFHLTGVKLEPGLVATPFRPRPAQTELNLCARYCNVGTGYAMGYAPAGGFLMAHGSFPQLMRVAPTMSVTSELESNNVSIIGFSPWPGGFRLSLTAMTSANAYYTFTYKAEGDM